MSVTPDGLPPLRDVIASLEIEAKKTLGQNFILDLNLTRRIARALGSLDGTTVVEVGPGPGGLTRALLLEGASRVIAVERDDRCRPALASIADRWPGRLDIVMADALATDWRALLRPVDAKVFVIANLPYNIATKLLIGWLETEPWPPWFSGLALMFQKEVAERIVAEPGSKAYGRLAVISQWRCAAEIELTLPPAAFTPPPKVSSAVVVLRPRVKPAPECRVGTLGRVTAAAFGQRRKMLRQSLKQLARALGVSAAEFVESAGIDPTQRPEELPPQAFQRLATIYSSRRHINLAKAPISA